MKNKKQSSREKHWEQMTARTGMGRIYTARPEKMENGCSRFALGCSKSGSPHS
ncbi:MAG: hypothetical protein ACLFUC_06500 [Bacteroidales bacterium]